jgi:hypothetical protein
MKLKTNGLSGAPSNSNEISNPTYIYFNPSYINQNFYHYYKSNQEPIMPGKAKAVSNGEDLKNSVALLGESIGLLAETEVKVGRRIWGAKRFIDVVLTHPQTRLRIGLECKFQGTGGSAEEKIPATIDNIRVWPIRGIVVIAGPGFSANMRAYLVSTGVVVEFEDLQEWLRMFFGL